MNLSDPPEMSFAYHKAHKLYGLFSALLIAWELIGIELKDLPYATIKSPQAPPFVLIALTCYFAFKITVEYSQCNKERKRQLPVRVDYWVAHSIALISLLLFLYQNIRQVQLVNEGSSLPFLLVNIVVIVVIREFVAARRSFLGYVNSLPFSDIRKETPKKKIVVRMLSVLTFSIACLLFTPWFFLITLPVVASATITRLYIFPPKRKVLTHMQNRLTNEKIELYNKMASGFSQEKTSSQQTLIQHLEQRIKEFEADLKKQQ